MNTNPNPNPKNKRERYDKYILVEALAKNIIDPRMCKSCGFGPVEPKNCSNLRQHHGQIVHRTADGKVVKINNGCPACGWFAAEKSLWPKWDGADSSTMVIRDNPFFIIDGYIKRLHWKNIDFAELCECIIPQGLRNRVDAYWSNLEEGVKGLMFIAGFMTFLAFSQAIGLNLISMYSYIIGKLGELFDWLLSNKFSISLHILAGFLDYTKTALESLEHWKHGSYQKYFSVYVAIFFVVLLLK